jgi:hypothetical protein
MLLLPIAILLAFLHNCQTCPSAHRRRKTSTPSQTFAPAPADGNRNGFFDDLSGNEFRQLNPEYTDEEGLNCAEILAFDSTGHPVMEYDEYQNPIGWKMVSPCSADYSSDSTSSTDINTLLIDVTEISQTKEGKLIFLKIRSTSFFKKGVWKLVYRFQ